MSRFNELGGLSRTLVRPPADRPGVVRAIATVVFSVVMVSTLGRAFATATSLALRDGGLVLMEMSCIAAPALWLARAGRLDAAWIFRLKMPGASTLAPTILIAMSGYVLAGSIEEWTQRLFGPLPVLDWEPYAPTGGLELAAALLALVVAPAVAEELLYRGCVLRALEPLGPRLPVSLLVGAIFAAAHLSPGTFPAHFFLGSAITFVVMCADSIYSGMAIHAGVNGIAVVLWRSELIEGLPDNAAANLAAAACFSCGAVWLARGPRSRS